VDVMQTNNMFTSGNVLKNANLCFWLCDNDTQLSVDIITMRILINL